MTSTTTRPPGGPKCASAHTYEDGALLVCPECAYEWAPGAEASAGDDGAVKLWDPTTAKPIGQLEPSDAYQHGDYTHAVNGLAFSPDGQRLISGSGDGTVRVWDAR